MKLTEQHVSEGELDMLIRNWEHGIGRDFSDYLVLPALLELKQRRAEDRQRENDGK
jgi:hypothetical protein